MYVPQFLYPFTCRWTSKLLLCPSYCKKCCNEHWGTYVSFNYDFLMVYAQQWDCWVILQFYSQFFKESLYCSPQRLYQCTFLPTGQENSLFCTSSPAFITLDLKLLLLWKQVPPVDPQELLICQSQLETIIQSYSFHSQ